LYDEFVIITFISWKGVEKMAQPELKNKTKTQIEDHSSLKGTLASVFILGFFLVITWVSVYFLFLDRL
jgi:hypothetical protein